MAANVNPSVSDSWPVTDADVQALGLEKEYVGTVAMATTAHTREGWRARGLALQVPSHATTSPH